MVLNLVRGASGDRPTVVQCQDPVRHGRHQVHVVLDHQYGDAQQILDVLDPERHIFSFFDVETRRGLVEQQELGTGTQGARQFGDLANPIR